MVPTLKCLLPPHRTRVDLTAGGLSLFLSLDPVGVAEIINDKDCLLMAFWRIFQDDWLYEQFCRRVAMTPFSEVTWREAQQYIATAEQRGAPETREDVLETGLAIFILSRFSLAANTNSFAPVSTGRLRRQMNEQVSAYLSAVDGLPQVRQRLIRCLLLCRDLLGAIQHADHADTFFYIDPPFLPETRVTKKLYRHEMTSEQHQELLDRLATIKGRFLLCSYPSSMYTQAINQNGWYFHDKYIDNKASKQRVKPQMVARCIMNYRPETDLPIEQGAKQ